MGQAKKRMMEEEDKRNAAFARKMEGYEKKIIAEEGEVAMYCPGCSYPLSKQDLKRDTCPHMDCGYSFLDKEGDRKF